VGEISGDFAMSLTSDMLWTAVKVAGPLIGFTMLVGLVVSILQVVTQIQESSLAFVPKLIAATGILLVFGAWMMGTLTNYATQLISKIPSYF